MPNFTPQNPKTNNNMRKRLHFLLLFLLALPMVMLAQEMRFVDQPDGTVKFSYRVDTEID
ncbi:MAG: hypothetical protein II747_07905 [Clostridia bacterium]|nr:hypothetical protein [Clostridia bacterium]